MTLSEWINFACFVTSTLTHTDKQNKNVLTAPFNNMRTLKLKAQPTNAFFATANEMFGGSSQLPTTAERAVIKSLCRAIEMK